MIIELRQYHARPGKREEMVDYMEKEIIPFFVSEGVNVVGSFVATEQEDLFVWLLGFENQEDRKRILAAVYESDKWKNTILPQIGLLNDREQAVTTLIVPTATSGIQ